MGTPTLPWRMVTAVVVLLCAAGIASTTGAASLPVADVVASIGFHLHLINAPPHGATLDAIVWQIRIPRVVLAALVGAALSGAGAAYQGVFRNPLVDPYLLGAAAGAGVGATIAIGYIAAPQWLVPLAFVGALVGVGSAYAIGAATGGLRSPAIMLLAGVAVMSFLTAVQTLLQQQRTETLQQVYGWILGQLSTAGWISVQRAAPGIVVGLAILLTQARALDIFELGDDKAKSLGIHVTRTRLYVLAGASLATASAVAVSGLIGFVGLVIPHIVRRLFTPSYRQVIPMSIVVGAAFLVATDTVARTASAPAEIPIGVITAFLGAPFFALLLRTSRNVAP